MKVREVTVKVESLHEGLMDFAATVKKMRRGEKVTPEETLSFDTVKVMREILTNERLRILKVVREKEPETTYALAKILKRPYSNVFNDVKKLAEMGLLELGREKGAVRPKAKYDRLNITIPV